MGPDDRGTVIYTRDQVTKVLPRCCYPLTVYRFSTDFDPSREMVVTTRGRAVELPTTAGCLPVMAVWQKGVCGRRYYQVSVKPVQHYQV